MGRYTLIEKKPRYSLIDPESKVKENPESQGWSGIGSDIGRMIKGTPGGLLNALRQAPEEISGLGKQALQPLWGGETRLPKNILAGANDLANSPADLADYFGRKGFTQPKQKSWQDELRSEVNDQGRHEAEREPISGQNIRLPKIDFGLGEKQSGDVAAQLIPSIIGPGGLGIKAIKKLAEKAPSFLPGSIGRELTANKQAVKKAAKHDYNELFADAKKHGIKDVPVPDINHERLLEHTSGREHEALHDYILHPTFENAHWAQSELGYVIRHFDEIKKNAKTSGGLRPSDNKTLKAAQDAQIKIKNAMHEQSGLAGHPELESRYKKLSADYANKVVPYGRLKELTQHEEKKLTNNNLIKSLLKNDEFMLGLGKQYKGMNLHKFIRSPLGMAIAVGLTGGKAAQIGYGNYHR